MNLKIMDLLSKSIPSLIFLCMAHFLIDFMIGIWPVYKTLADLDLAIAGLIWAVGASCGEGMQLLFGRMADSGYRKKLIITGLFLSSVGAFFAFFTNYYILCLLFWMVCLGSGAFHPSAVGLVGKLTETKKGTFITIFAAFGALGIGVSQIIYTWFYNHAYGSTLWLFIPVVMLATFLLQKPLIRQGGALAERPKLKQFLKFFQNRGLKLLYISQICNQAITWGFMFLLPDVLKVRGYEPMMVFGGGHLAYILGGVLFLIPSGYLADKYSARSVILGSTGIGMLLFYAFLFSPELENAAALTLLFGLGGMLSIVNPVTVALGNKLAPHHPGMVSAFLMGCVWCVAEFIGPGGGGLLTKLFENDAPARALMLLGSISLIGLVAVYRLPSKVAEQVVSPL